MLVDEVLAAINHGDVPQCLLQALRLVVEHAARLPRLHQQQASSGDTALLMVGPCLVGRSLCSGWDMTVLSPPAIVMASVHATMR